MRIRATVAALSGPRSCPLLPPRPHADAVVGDTTITQVIINGGKPVVIGTAKKTFSVSVTATRSPGRSTTRPREATSPKRWLPWIRPWYANGSATAKPITATQ
ncbi:hypothetical protein [Actinacidiphila oryziradicis]|uniref:hypothetical protein n=1 Tax=Actinacidiphila oryziradicis TaxID=2571141 RepID=UPI0023F41E49|nr:hypothetical protein [Actinacidiphila oryziradicis]MCW2871465.1 calcium-binding protein [Actinacidiphila oryziradicis]